MTKRHNPSIREATRSPSTPLPARVGDHLALDFLNTISAPKGTPIEQIGSGHELLQWLIDAGVLVQDEAERLESSWPQAQLDGAAHEAVALREWFRDVLTRAKSGRFPNAEGDLAPLNNVLARDDAFQRVILNDGDGQLRIESARQWHAPSVLLVPIAIAMAELLCDTDFDLIGRCENPACTLWFYDRTKGHRRRWCSQAVCGNRAKVAAHRMRKKSAN